MAKPICPKCGKEAECFHDGDVGAGPRYIDQYRLECPHCDYKDIKTVDGGDSSWNDHPTDCPFCGLEGPVGKMANLEELQ